MADRDAWEQPLYRFARLLLRDEAAARKAVAETLEAGAKKRPPQIDPDRLVMLQFRDVRRQALKAQTATAATARSRPEELPPNADSALRGLEAGRLGEVLHALPEPGRSAYALLLLDAMESEWIAKLLGLAPAEFANTVHGARLAVHQALVAKVAQ